MGTLSTVPISDDEFRVFSEAMERYPVLGRIYRDGFQRLMREGSLTREYPLIEAALQYGDEPNDYFEQVSNLIAFHGGNNTAGLDRVLNESKNKIDFYHSISQMELGRAFLSRGFTVELDDDLVLHKDNMTIYLEVKTFQEDEQTGLVIAQLAVVPSRYHVEIVHQLTTIPQSEVLIQAVRERLGAVELPAPFSVAMPGSVRAFAHVTFLEKEAGDDENRTGIIIRNSEAVEISEKDNVSAITRQLEKASEQLDEDYRASPKFVVFDIVNSNQNLLHSKRADLFRKILYGSRCMLAKLERSLQPRSVANALSDDNLIEIQMRNIQDIIRDYDLDALNREVLQTGFTQTVEVNLLSKPLGEGQALQYTFLETKGEFFKSEYSGTNGVMVRTHQGLNIFLNPFVRDEIEIDEPTIMSLFGLQDMSGKIEVMR